jgi:hypothetical protein
MQVNPLVVAFLRPAVDNAVDRAVHDNDPIRFHRRYPRGLCPVCAAISLSLEDDE